MNPMYQDDWLQVWQGDCRKVLDDLPGLSIQTVVTSPPYWGLRDYGVDEQLGLESTPDEYVRNLVDVFRSVRHVLADDGTVWLNLGDSYAAGRGGSLMPAETLAGGERGKGDEASYRGRMQVPDQKNPNAPIMAYQPHRNAEAIGLKHKDMVGIPWRVAFALQEDGWYLRSDIIWSKPNPMPESVTDRPTKSHEYLFLMSKRENYYYDYEAVLEPLTSTPEQYLRAGKSVREHHQYGEVAGRPLGEKSFETVPLGRNLRSVWTIPTEPYTGAHFATFPQRLVEPCIKAGTRPGDTVLDPFAGSGTTGLVAQRLSRRAVLIDLNPEYLMQAMIRNNNVPLGI